MVENKQYSLFEDESGKVVAFDESKQPKQENLEPLSMDELFKYLDERGLYSPLPEKELWSRALTYYDQHIEQITDYLTASGLTQAQTHSVTVDYFNALVGNFSFRTPITTMKQTLEKIKPYEAFMIDKYGFYRLLLLQYYNFGKVTVNYIADIRNADPETKTQYIANFPTMKLKAIDWAILQGYITLSDFAGVPSNMVAAFANNARKFAHLFDYGQYYHLCKYAYLATPEQLKTIRTPNELEEVEAKGHPNFAERFCKDCEQWLNIAAKQYAAPAYATNTPQEQEQAQEQAQEWTIKQPTLSLNNTLLSIQSRGIYGVPNGEIKGGILPIKTYIENFLKTNEITLPVTPYQIEQAIDGVNIMALDKQSVKPVNGYYTYKTNLSEFSRYCGLIDANQTTNKQLLQALRVIDYAAWLVVWRPKGPAAVRVLTITEISEKGDFTINVTAEAMKGKPNLVTQQGYEKLRAETKGQPKAHFRNQILSKGHKTEEELIKECWDYQTKYDLAKERGDQELKEFLQEWTKRKGRFKKQLRAWFDEYADNGAISYTYTTKDKQGVYTWRKGKLLKADKPNDIITDAEIVDAEQPTGETLPEQ